VPGSPFFVLVDGRTGERVGQGVASSVASLTELVRRAETERGPSAPQQRATDIGLGGPAREAAADEALLAAGILPGDRSLYPGTLEDMFPLSATGADDTLDRAVGGHTA
jgi:hypothetical protein